MRKIIGGTAVTWEVRDPEVLSQAPFVSCTQACALLLSHHSLGDGCPAGLRCSSGMLSEVLTPIGDKQLHLARGCHIFGKHDAKSRH